jgi:ketosteroid isomerase-like protein
VSRHPIELLIEKADWAINQEDFETLIGLYSDDAVLVVSRA